MWKLAIALPFVVVAGCGAPIESETEALKGGTPAHAAVCGAPGPGEARCHSHVLVDENGAPRTSSTPSGFAPADLQSAYNVVGSTGGAGQLVAIIDAQDNPNVEADLGVYRKQFGLPPCTTANGCFRKVDQRGGTKFPKGDTSWGQEISLDVDMVSALCPNCSILLVETDNAQMTNLGAGVNTAVALGATVISNSYGGAESAGEVSQEAYYNHPGVVITASSGDSGYGAEYPAASQYVTAVGGTHLVKSGNNWVETAWSGAGSGCSAYIAKPAWQSDTGCAKRSIADVSAVADPNTGVAVYDSYGHGRSVGWMVFGGTSVAAPVVAAIYALAGNAGGGDGASNVYSHASALNDVTSGSNGNCGGTYLCTAGQGYDGPTGLGTPNGTDAF